MSNEKDLQVELRGLTELLKAKLIENIALASRKKQISINEQTLPGLKLLLDASVDQAFAVGTKNILKFSKS